MFGCWVYAIVILFFNLSDPIIQYTLWLKVQISANQKKEKHFFVMNHDHNSVPLNICQFVAFRVAIAIAVSVIKPSVTNVWHAQMRAFNIIIQVNVINEVNKIKRY